MKFLHSAHLTHDNIAESGSFFMTTLTGILNALKSFKINKLHLNK